MTWTYGNDPAGSTRDEVRFLVGDTDTLGQLVSDEEITYALGAEPGAKAAAAHIAEAISAKFARRADKSVGDLSINWSQQSEQYAALARRLRADSSISNARVYAGGISIADKQVDEGDSDNVTPSFKRGFMDDPNTATNTVEDT